MSRLNTELYNFRCTMKTETDSALLVFDPVSKKDFWIPLSQIEERYFNPMGEGVVAMTAWIARKKGLI